jgi:hypothetical protein
MALTPQDLGKGGRRGQSAIGQPISITVPAKANLDASYGPP